jgi:short-subunit dehydrogenase
MTEREHPLAIVTGASSGIGFELARCCAENGFDLVIAAEEPAIHDAADTLRASRVVVTPCEVDLATTDGVDKVCDACTGHAVSALLATAGRGTRGAFLDQNFGRIQQVIAANVTGTLYLIHRVGRQMQDWGRGRILIAGSAAGLMPGTYQAVYNGVKALLDSFSYALRAELKDSGVTVTCLMPGATETELFQRDEPLDTEVGTDKKASAADVARVGFEAMMRGEGDVIAGRGTELRAALSHGAPSPG